MTSADSSTMQAVSTAMEEQRLLKLGQANEIFEVQRSRATAYSRQESGLRQRLPRITVDSDVVNDDGEEECLLGDRTAKSSQSSLKTQNGFSKSIEKYFSACRFNVRFKPRRPAKPKKFVTPPEQLQTDPEGDHGGNIPCLGQRWRGLRKRLGDMIKIEEEIFISVPRSVLYYA